MATLEDLIKEVKDLTDAVANAGDRSTVDVDKLAKDLESKMADLVAAQVKAREDAAPQLRKPGSSEVDHEDKPAPLAKGNRYAAMVRDFYAKGFHKVGTAKAKPVDLWLANRLMQKTAELAKLGLLDRDKVVSPSQDLELALKAMDTTTNADHLPREMADMLWDEIYLASRVAGNLNTIDMPTNPFDIPLGLGQPVWRKGTQNVAVAQSNVTPGKSTLTATELVTDQAWSYTLDEDAIIAMMPQLRARLAQSGAEIIDDFMINADSTNAATGNINLDDADPPDDSYYLTDGQDGIRHLWLVDNAAQGVNAGGAALTDAHIVAALGRLDKYGINPEDVMIITGAAEYLRAFLVTGTGSPGEFVSTIDKAGPNAIIMTGQLASYRGLPIVISASHRKAEADGKRSAIEGNNTLGSLSFVNRRMWYAGFRRRILVEVDRDIQKRQMIMVTSLRVAVAAHGPRSTATHTSGIRNVLI